VLEALAARGVAPRSADISVRANLLAGGPKRDRKGKKRETLSEREWAGLPAMLRRPAAVLVHEKNGNLIYVLKETDETGRVRIAAIQLDYRRKGEDAGNMVLSAYWTNAQSLRGSIPKERTLLVGSLEDLE
jgi:hypothetical protein